MSGGGGFLREVTGQSDKFCGLIETSVYKKVNKEGIEA